MDFKVCRTCKRELPKTEEYFRPHKRGVDGFSPRCNECNPLKTEYYKNHRDVILDRSYNYMIENREQKNKKQAKYRENNRDFLNNLSKEWNEANLERFKENSKRWRKENPERMSYHQKIRKMNKEHDITEQEWLDCLEYFYNTCAYCGISEKDALITYNQLLHKEHVDHNGANDITNCVPSCKGCNSSKHISTLNEWYNEDNKIYSKRRYNKIIKWLLSFTEECSNIN